MPLKTLLNFRLRCSVMFEIIVATDNKRGIGKEGALPWSVPRDLKYFKHLTSQTKNPNAQNMLVMGRKTAESLPNGALPNRLNVVLSTQNSSKEGFVYVSSWDAMCALAEEKKAEGVIERVFIIGGSAVYKCALEDKKTTRIWQTKLYDSFDCDAFFPSYDSSEWQGLYASSVSVPESGPNMAFFSYAKRPV